MRRLPNQGVLWPAIRIDPKTGARSRTRGGLHWQETQVLAELRFYTHELHDTKLRCR
jgi:hypothetical protein